MNTITVRFKGVHQEQLSRAEYDALRDSGMLWEFYPDAPHTWPEVIPAPKDPTEAVVHDCRECRHFGTSYRSLPCSVCASLPGGTVDNFEAAHLRQPDEVVPARQPSPYNESYQCLQKAFAEMQNGYCRQLTLQQNANRRKNRKLRGLRAGRRVDRSLLNRYGVQVPRLLCDLSAAERRAEKAEAEVRRLEAAMDRAASG